MTNIILESITLKYRLRCVFHYFDTKPSWRSMWNRSGEIKENQAWCQSKTNLRCAQIEGEDIVTHEVKILAECAGQDFCNFEWYAVKAVPLLGGRGQDLGTNIGLVLVTRDEFVKILVTGDILREARSDKHKNLIQYASYGK